MAKKAAPIAITDEQRKLMLHALGEPLQKKPHNNKCYRNRYCQGSEENEHWEALVTQGLAWKKDFRGDGCWDAIYYGCTREGILVATNGKYSEVRE